MSRPRAFRIVLSKKERKIIRHLQKKTPSPNARTRFAIILEADESNCKGVPTYRDIAIRAGASVPTVIDQGDQPWVCAAAEFLPSNSPRHRSAAKQLQYRKKWNISDHDRRVRDGSITYDRFDVGEDRIEYHISKCVYIEMFEAYGIRGLCRIFCMTDTTSYEHLRRHVTFIRHSDLSDGEECYDEIVRRRKPQ